MKARGLISDAHLLPLRLLCFLVLRLHGFCIGLRWLFFKGILPVHLSRRAH